MSTIWCLVFGLAILMMSSTTLVLHENFSGGAIVGTMEGNAAEKSVADYQRCQPKDIRELSRLLQRNLGRMGLRPVEIVQSSSSSGESNQSFPGLTKESMSSTLRGKRIAMMGDSQLWYFSKWLNFLLDEDAIGLLTQSFQNGTNFTGFDRMDMGDAYQHSKQWLHNVCRVKTLQEAAFGQSTNVSACDYYWSPTDMNLPRDDTRLLWSGLSYTMDHRVTEHKLSNMFNVTKQLQPNIIVTNMGIHWLHFYNIARDVSLEGLQRWIHYEEWLQQVFDFAYSETQATVLLYKTTNFICDKKLYDSFQVANDGYEARNPDILRKCNASVSQLDPIYFSTEQGQSHVLEYCVNGTINNRGTSALNRRMRSYLQETNLLRTHYRENSSLPPLHVDIFDDNIFQSCDYCSGNDGMHYHKLNLLRARMMANQVACLQS